MRVLAEVVLSVFDEAHKRIQVQRDFSDKKSPSLDEIKEVINNLILKNFFALDMMDDIPVECTRSTVHLFLNIEFKKIWKVLPSGEHIRIDLPLFDLTRLNK